VIAKQSLDHLHSNCWSIENHRRFFEFGVRDSGPSNRLPAYGQVSRFHIVEQDDLRSAIAFVAWMIDACRDLFMVDDTTSRSDEDMMKHRKICSVALSISIMLPPIKAQSQERIVETLTNESIVSMLTGKVPKSLVISKIQSTGSAFDVTAPGIVALYYSKVPTDVIRYMMQAVPAARSNEVLTNDGVILMVSRQLPRDLILTKIQSTAQNFDLTADGLVRLNQNKVPSAVIKVMMAPGTGAVASNARPIGAIENLDPPTATASTHATNPATPVPNRMVSLPRNCKPDVSSFDKITKAKFESWGQDVYTTGFLSQVVLESAEVNINTSIVRVGDLNFIRVVLTKDEEKIARAVLEDRYRAAKGNVFLLGFKQGGTPFQFVADDATSVTAGHGVVNPKSRTTVVLAAQIKNEDLKALRDSLGTRQFDGIRVMLPSMTIEKSINDGNGRKLTEKFQCFFAHVEQQGVLR
jgi:hypothetical protein